MARKIIHQLVDDIDGTVLETGVGETVTFGLDGRMYEIDLGARNAEKLREVFATYIGIARRTTGGLSPVTGTARRGRPGAEQLAAIRTWARENGYTVSDRGRVAQTIVDAYNAAH